MSEELQIVEYEGVRVVTTKQIAEMYGTENSVVSKDFNRNKGKFTEGKHYFRLSGNELKSFREIHEVNSKEICGGQNDDCKSLRSPENGLQISNKARVLYLWTNRGALLLAKIIDTDNAWAAYERLVDFYFEVKEEFNPPIEQIPEEKSTITYQTSSTPVPKNPSWYERNKRRMNWMCKINGKSLSSLYHVILVRISEEYDINAANMIYEQERGEPPKYPMDIVNYFPDLARMADDILDGIEKRLLRAQSGNK